MERGVESFVVKRVATVVVVALVVEAALYGGGRFAPALAELARTVMWIAAVAFLIALWRAARTRHTGADRRNGDRRERPTE